jgi:hypothetical protein
LLKVIHHKITKTNIQRAGAHIKGHQDDSITYHLLDRTSQINILTDQMAREHLQYAKTVPRHYSVCSQSWSRQLEGIPLIQNIKQTLYNHVHSPVTKQYWIRKSRITDRTFSSVLWPWLGKAMDKMPLQRRLFCSKHTAGMCGVRKFQKIWKTKETTACPHCGQFED